MATDHVRLPDGTILHFHKDSLRRRGADHDLVGDARLGPSTDTLDVSASRLANFSTADARGPEPRPDWLLTEDGASEADVRMVRTGKEANVWLVRRTGTDGHSHLLAAKRYRRAEHRTFRDDSLYTAGRRTGDDRVDRAIRGRTRRGRLFARQFWVSTEFELLCELHERGVPVPYPVQRNGTELLLQHLGDEQGPAPRLADLRPEAAELRELFEQVRAILIGIARAALVHADFSPHNLLVHDAKVWLIDLPQAVRFDRHPNAETLLARDVRVITTWFRRRGLDVDAPLLGHEVLRATRHP